MAFVTVKLKIENFNLICILFFVCILEVALMRHSIYQIPNANYISHTTDTRACARFLQSLGAITLREKEEITRFSIIQFYSILTETSPEKMLNLLQIISAELRLHANVYNHLQVSLELAVILSRFDIKLAEILSGNLNWLRGIEQGFDDWCCVLTKGTHLQCCDWQILVKVAICWSTTVGILRYFSSFNETVRSLYCWKRQNFHDNYPFSFEVFHLILMIINTDYGSGQPLTSCEEW